MNSQIYQAENFFMLRVPILPLEVYLNLFGSEQGDYEDNVVTFLKNHPEVKEAITIASSSLGAALKNLDELLTETKDRKKRTQVFSAITKYLIRMSTRTTPYGLFSGVALGHFSNQTEITLDKEYTKRTRPDMEWIYEVIRKIETDDSLIWNLKVRANPLGVENGNRLDMCYISNYGQVSTKEKFYNMTASIRHTKQVAFVMDYAKDFVVLSEIRETIMFNNPQVEQIRIEGFLKELLKNEYLITELRPPLINENPFQYILKILEHVANSDQYYNELKEVEDKIQAYDTANIGDGVDLYEAIIEKMKKIHEVSNYLQVDLAVSGSEIEINNKVKESLNELIDILSHLSSVYSKSHLDDYLNEFIEVYGEEREIPLLELLDEDKGLGAPATYTKPLSRKNYSFSGKTYDEEVVEKYFKLKMSEVLIQGKTEIVIKQEEIEALNIKTFNINECIESLEVYVFIQKQNEENYEVSLGPNYGSSAAGKTFGRFMDIMPSETKKIFENLSKKENEVLGKDKVIAEIVELPQNGRSSNVTLNWSPKTYEINMATTGCHEKNQISIQDLYIGVAQVNDKKKFYIKSGSLNKEVCVKANNMANYTIFSNLYRFLCEVSEYGKVNPFSVIHKLEGEYFKNFGYVPKIRYKNIVLQPECWHLTELALGIKKEKLERNLFYKALDRWRENWNVTKNVYLTEYDNRLMLDLTHPVHREELYQTFIKSSKPLLLTGIDDKFEGLIVKNALGSYFSEIVVPMHRVLKDEKVSNGVELTEFQNEVLKTKSQYKNHQRTLKTWDDNRTFILGDEWMYFKVYGVEKRIDEFIGYELSEFCKSVKLKNISSEFFFIRYADPAPHVRLRFKVKKEKQGEMIQTINLWFKELIENGLLSKVQMDTYLRETERYGGVELIELAEKIFHYDSVFVTEILKMKRMGEIKENFDYFVCASVIDIFEGLGISYKAQNELFSKLIDKKLHREEFKTERKMYMNLCNSNFEWENLRKEPLGEEWYIWFKKRREYLGIFSEKMMILDLEGKLTNSRVSIILSLVHMHFNRIYGSVSKERKLMAMIRHTLQSLEYTKVQEDAQIIETTS